MNSTIEQDHHRIKGRVTAHDSELERLVTERAPDLMAFHGIATLTIAEMLILVGDVPTRIRS